MDTLFEKDFSIELPKLKPGTQEFWFEINEAFFEKFEDSQVDKGDIEVKAVVHKFESHLNVSFEFSGTITLNCDRCTEPYDHPVESVHSVVYTFEARDNMEDSDDIIIIDRDEHLIDLSGELYDFIHLEIPLRKVPPFEVHKCDDEILEKLDEAKQKRNDDEIDPRWEKLKELKERNKD